MAASSQSSQSSQWARGLVAAVAVALLALTHHVASELRHQLAFSLANASLGVANTTFFNRANVTCAIAEALSSRTHLLLLGPSGVGKTVAAKLAVSISTPLQAPGGSVCLLPLYVDLHALMTEHMAGAGGVSDASDAAVRAFSKAVISLDFPSLRNAEMKSRLAVWRYALSVFPTNLLDILEPWFWQLSVLPRPYEPSVYGLLTHIVDAAEALTRDSRCDLGAGRMLPVLILDEVHVLNETHMSAVRADVLRFIWPQLQAKQTARMTIVLLSSDARAHDIVQTWTPANKLARRLTKMHIGDLRAHEVPHFLDFLNRTAPAWHGTGYMGTPEGMRSAYARAGGHAADLRRMFVALHPDDLHDESSVAALASATQPRLSTSLAATGLDPRHVAAVFGAITERGVSARGAVTLASLTAAGVPPDQVREMEIANLVEIRRYDMAGGADYEELRALGRGAYVCAPRPLARESMVQVLAALRAEVEVSLPLGLAP